MDLALLVFSAFSKNSEVSVVSETSWISKSAAVMFSTSLSFSLLPDSLLSVSFSGNIAGMAETSSGIKSDCWLIALSLLSGSFLG